MKRFAVSVAVTLAAALVGVLPCPAAETADPLTATGEVALLAGYGISHPGFGATRTQVQTVDAILRYGHFLSGEMGSGWYRGRHELFLELPVHLVVDPRDRVMTGGYILGSWKLTSWKDDKLYPYAFAGGGVLFNDLGGLANQGTRLDYSYQGGIGLQYLLRSDLAFMGEYRYHHVSNAGTATPNEPLNSSKFLFGLTRFF
jgi:lipid A 3-O-deacylase